MPRLIDHDERDRQIGEAAIRVLAADGLAALSVRKVADEAGIATASLRRAFPTQEALRRFCVGRIRDDVAGRIAALRGEGRPLVLRLLSELLPLDDARRRELAAQLQLAMLALTDRDLGDSVAELHDAVRTVCVSALQELKRTGGMSPDADLPREAARLHALLDGLALQLLSTRPADPAGVAEAMLEHHIDALSGGAARA